MNNLRVSLRRYLPKVSLAGKAVLVTGCDSGFGAHVADHLSSLGFRVFAGCLSRDAALKSQAPNPGREFLQMNVSSDREVREAAEQIRARLADTGTELWAVINNAGISTYGELEWVPLEVFKQLQDVNVWGTIRVTQACLPLIRHSKGRVINISSMLGRMAYPLRSPYCVTKFSLEALSDCLRYEMKRWGVHVVLVEPGNFIAGTNIYSPESVQKTAAMMWDRMPDHVKEAYGKEYFDGQVAKMMVYIQKGDTDLSPVSRCMEDAVLSKTPLPRYIPASMYYWTRIQAATHLPVCVYGMVYKDIS